VWEEEILRFMSYPNIKVHFGFDVTPQKFNKLKNDYDYVVVAVGTHEPRKIPFPGSERVITALDFLKTTKTKKPMKVGKRVVIIGAGNVGCDVACEAYKNGAEQVTLIDIQKPLAFGKEKAAAEALGAKFAWPVITREVTDKGLIDKDGKLYPADTVMICIGDIPAIKFLPDTVETIRGWIKTDEAGRTSDPKVLAVATLNAQALPPTPLALASEALNSSCRLLKVRSGNHSRKKLFYPTCLPWNITVLRRLPIQPRNWRPIAVSLVVPAGTAISAKPSARPMPFQGEPWQLAASNTFLTRTNASPAVSAATPALAASGPCSLDKFITFAAYSKEAST